MKKNDFWFLVILVAFFSPFFLSETAQYYYNTATTQHALLMSFAKFSILATLGEVIGLRISQGIYTKEGFGLLPRAIFWGFTGVLIKIAFVIFATGSPMLVDHYFYKLGENPLAGNLTAAKVLVAFSISVCMNLMFAPLFMTLHKVSDIHIEETGGTLGGYFSKIDFARILKKIDWSVMWGFVFKKTLPLFWIPAHTITFLLPPNFQILFAALLGIVLGLILAVAGMSKPKKMTTAAAV
ncbi:hypothetical protein [Syntrophotalea acetylenica]|uniref:Mpv17 / PMP22 family protein n=1 Tax=Syntrophotalea acetylenica TaxID=29542 RepID=A0A1L3GE46_SYNAC|nr:hypothetical protein [Syntrophotalea acetylenica]APG23958.1 hypothetical protein A7E75_02165 [Syntrophotalea acetylenica]APG44539.1 hypothetical protein A6070_10780 [Syntrophotalea acetylenica]